MTKNELKEIEQRCLAGTKGNWFPMIEGVTHTSGDDFIMTGVDDIENINCSSRGKDMYLVNGTKEDLEFIANAKQDIPRLIAEIRKLKKEIEKASC